MALQWASLFLAGLLAGEELVVRYGVHPALASLGEHASIGARQALILKLRILVPSIFLPTAATSVIALLVDWSPWRLAGSLLLLAWGLTTGIGTVPINSAVIQWDAAAPPADWHDVIARWARIDILRSSAALVAFACLVVGAALD
jgi:uncharacterized membrane protein